MREFSTLPAGPLGIKSGEDGAGAAGSEEAPTVSQEPARATAFRDSDFSMAIWDAVG